jgi:hypothetical protein
VDDLTRGDLVLELTDNVIGSAGSTGDRTAGSIGSDAMTSKL